MSSSEQVCGNCGLFNPGVGRRLCENCELPLQPAALPTQGEGLTQEREAEIRVAFEHQMDWHEACQLAVSELLLELTRVRQQLAVAERERGKQSGILRELREELKLNKKIRELAEELLAEAERERDSLKQRIAGMSSAMHLLQAHKGAWENCEVPICKREREIARDRTATLGG